MNATSFAAPFFLASALVTTSALPVAANVGPTVDDVASPAAGASAGPNTDTSQPQTRVAQPSAAPAPAATFPGLLGDFGGGERAKLAAHGFTVNGHLTSEFAANTSGGFPIGGTAHERGTALSSEFGFGFDADFGKLFPKSGAGILHLLLTTRFGSNLSSEAIGNLSSVQEIYGDGQTTRITFLDYEQPIAHNRFDLRLGKYNQQNDFIAGSTYWGSDLYCFYQNNTICGTPASIPVNNGVVADGSEGYTYYPSSQWGARLKASLGTNTYVQAAAIQGNPRVNDKNGGLYFGFNGGTGVELPVEIGETFKNAGGETLGNLRLGAYYDTSDVQNYASRAGGALTLLPDETTAAGLASNAAAIATLGTTYVRGRSGAYVQADREIEGSSAAGKRGTAIFTSFEYSDPQTSLVSTFFEFGAVHHGTFASRPSDTIAVAFAEQNYNVRLQRLESTLQSAGYVVPNTTSDQVVELNYGVSATSWLVIRPGVQYVIDPGGIKANPASGVYAPAGNAIVIGLGAYISL
jgi:porin